MSAGVFILILVVAIAALVLMIVKAKMHPVLALFIAALGTGIALGYGVTGSVDYISNGFGGTLGSVGITIILGAIISMAIEDTGAAKVIANFFIKLFRGKRMELAPALTAFIMSIPVFGDITMVLTAPIASMLSKRKHISMSTMASFTGLGLFLTHGLVPPTPGILAIALMFGSDLGMTIVWGLVISFVGFFGTYFLLRKWTEKEWIEPNPEFVRGMEETDSDSVDDILIKDPGLPHTGEGFLPLLLPVLLISVSSFAAVFPSVGSGVYAATKSAVKSMVNTLAAELAPYGIRVNGYIPGVIDTDMTHALTVSNGEAMKSAIAMQTFGEPMDVAWALAFLASDYARYITGTTLEISGGKMGVQNPAKAWKDKETRA